MTWALTCLETVHQRPCMMRESETWLSDSRIGNNISEVDHRGRRPVLSPLHNCVDRCHIWPYWASRCKPWKWASISGSTLSVAALQRRERGETLLSTGKNDSCVGCRQPEIRCIEPMILGVDEICVAGSSQHWTAVFCDWITHSQSWCAEGACADTPWSTSKFHNQVVPAL